MMNTQLLQQQGSPSGLLGLSHLLLLALQGPMMMLMEAAIVTPLRMQGDFPRPARALHLGVRASHLSLLHRCEAERPPPASHSSISRGLTPLLPALAPRKSRCSGALGPPKKHILYTAKSLTGLRLFVSFFAASFTEDLIMWPVDRSPLMINHRAIFGTHVKKSSENWVTSIILICVKGFSACRAIKMEENKEAGS